MSITKKVKTVIFKKFNDYILGKLISTLINEYLIAYQSINSNHNLFVYTSLEWFHNISDNGCSNVLYKESENS